MNAERWQRVQEILELLNEAEPSKREGILERECGDDATLRAEVLRFDALQGDVGAAFLEQPVVATGSSQGNEDLVKGAVVGERWRVIEPIGRGGMGSVYRAERTGDYEQLAAIKVVHRGMDTRQVVGRFENERQILATLEHRSIARVLDGGTLADGRP
ncbi:MAG: serine/threonine protein kinase, partial [Acidobacteriota bacterium]